MSLDPGIATDSRPENLATDATSSFAGIARSAPGLQHNIEAGNQLWSADRSHADGHDRAPWGGAMAEFSIWGPGPQASCGESADAGSSSIWDSGSSNSISSMLRGIAGEGMSGLSNTNSASAELGWPKPDQTAASNSLGLTDLHKEAKPWGFGVIGYNSSDASAFRPLTGTGDGWGLPSSTPTEQKPVSADWSASKDKDSTPPEQASAWPVSIAGNTNAEQQNSWPRTDQNGLPAHTRSASAVSDSSGGKEPPDNGKSASSASVSGEQSGGAATPLTAEELLIQQMVNSNEGWGTRPVRQDTPWTIETTSPGPIAPASSTSTDSTSGGTKTDVWNQQSSGQYWGGTPTAGPTAAAHEWRSDNDIGVWNGPLPPDAAAAQFLAGQAGWSGRDAASRLNTADITSGLAAGGWPDAASGLAAMAPGLANKGRPTDAQWMQALSKPQQNSGWNSDSVIGTWGAPNPQDLLRAQMQSSGLRAGAGQFDVPPPNQSTLKIDNWNEPASQPDTLLQPGHWGQPPVNVASGQAQLLDAQLQQLMRLGMKREDAIQKLMASSAAVDAMNPSRPGTSLGDMISAPSKGRMLRGQSVGEVDSASAALLSQLASSQQMLGKMGQQHMAMGGAGIGHRKQLSAGSGGWPGQQTMLPGGMPSQQQAHVNNLVIQLQSVLQPKLQLRSRIQQDRMIPLPQKRQQLDIVNAEITALKQQIDMLQLSSGPIPTAAAPQPPPAALHGQQQALTDLLRSVAAGGDAALAQQLLSQLKLDQQSPAELEALLKAGGIPDGLKPGGDGGFGSQWPDSSGWPPVGMRMPAGLPQQPQDASDPAAWNRAAADKFKGVGGVGASPTWLLLNNFTIPLDGPRIQQLCLQQGLLQTFFFNKSSNHALACFTNRDDAISARATLGAFPFAEGAQPLCSAEIVSGDSAQRLLTSGHWAQLTTATGLSTVAPPLPKGRGSGSWSSTDSM